MCLIALDKNKYLFFIKKVHSLIYEMYYKNKRDNDDGLNKRNQVNIVNLNHRVSKFMFKYYYN